MNAHQRSIPIPKIETALDCAFRRQVLRQRPPLTPGAQLIEQTIANPGCRLEPSSPLCHAHDVKNQALAEPAFPYLNRKMTNPL